MEFSSRTITIQKKKLISQKYIFLDTLGRSNGSRVNPQIYLPANLFTGTEQGTKYLEISLTNLTINHSWYDIRNGVNNEYSLWDGATWIPKTIPEGCPSVYDIRDTLNIDLLGYYVVTYVPTQNKFIFTASDPSYQILCQTAGKSLGLENGSTSSGTFTSSKPINIQYSDCIYLNSDIATNSYNLDNVNNSEVNSSTIIERIPVNNPPFDNIQFENEDSNCKLSVAVSNTFLSSVSFWLTFSNGTKLTESDISDEWSFILKIQIYQ